jgi:chromosome segregation ATPase
MKCNQDKQEHNIEINEIKRRFEEYRLETDEYKKKIGKIIADLEAKLQTLNEQQALLNEKQEEHGVSIKELSAQGNTFNKLSQKIELMINARRSDLDKLDEFTKRLDNINELLNQVQQGLYPLNRIPSLEQEIQEIRNLIIHQNTFGDLELRLSQAQKDILRHNGDIEQINGKLYTFESLYQELKLKIDGIKDNDNDIRIIQQHLTTIDIDLQRKSLEINQVNILAKEAIDQINGLREFLASISKNLSDLENNIRENENIMDSLNRRALEDSLKEFIRQIKESVSNLHHQLTGQINEAKIFINLLKTQLDALLNAQQPEKIPAILGIVPRQSKVMRYVEPLQPTDLIRDIWTNY